MTTPTYEQLLEDSTIWKKRHKGIEMILYHHGYIDPKHLDADHINLYTGTYCYYLLIREQMFPHRWQNLACKRSKNGFVEHGSGWNDVEFHNGITWSSSQPYWCRETQKYWDASGLVFMVLNLNFTKQSMEKCLMRAKKRDL